MTERYTAARTDAEISSQSSEPRAAHQRLNVFVGTWETDGQQYEGPVGPAAKISAVETYEWLKGELFLVHRFDGRVGDGEAACIEVIGHDAQTHSYPTHTFYNNGLSTEWDRRERDGTWTLTGDWRMENRLMKVRCTTAFSDGGHTMSGTWEHSSDGSNWQTFWNVKATKAR